MTKVIESFLIQKAKINSLVLIMSAPEKYDKIIKKKTLWLKSGKPSAEELIAYLYNPDTMECYMECLKPEWKYIPVFKGYQKIAFKDLALKEDPSIKLAQKYSINIKWFFY